MAVAAETGDPWVPPEEGCGRRELGMSTGEISGQLLIKIMVHR